MEQWTSTLDTRIAAAIGTLGVPTRIETTYVEVTGQRVSRIHMALCSLDLVYQTKKIIHGYQTGELERLDPTHPFLTIQRAYLNRMAILDLQNQGKFQRLATVPGTCLWQYVPSNTGLPGVAPGLQTEVIRTSDLKLVAALGVIGIPLLAIEGGTGNHAYFLPRYGPAGYLGQTVDGLALMQAWRADKQATPWEDPFAQAMRGLFNRERYLDAIRKDVELILMTKPRAGWKSAFVRADSTPAGFDRAKHHLDS
jgi:hypothetical protein